MKKFVLLLAIPAIALSAPAQSAGERGKQPLVLITGQGGTHWGGGSVSKHDETMELARDLLKDCSEITLTTKEKDPTPDYILSLNRQEEHWGSAVTQIMLLRGGDEVVLWSDREGRVSKAARKGCDAILANWKKRHEPASQWNKEKP